MGLLEDQAPYAADLNLITQMITLSLLLVGVYFARTARLGIHRRLMKLAVIIQIGALILWMVPSLLLNIGAVRTFAFGPLVTVLHALGGIFALALAISAIYHRRMASLQLKCTMWSTFLAWTLVMILGIGFYVYYYVI